MTQVKAPNKLQQGIAAAKSGNKPLARQHLLQAIETYPDNESCWLWLAIVAESPEERTGYLQQALTINPDNQRTLQAIAQLQVQIAQRAVSAAPTFHCPLCHKPVPDSAEQCAACGAFLTLTDIEAVLNNDRIDQVEMNAAIHRLKHTQASNGARADVYYHLALAYLNLNQLEAGTAVLQSVLRFRPNDQTLREQVRALQERALQERQTMAAKPVPAEPAPKPPTAVFTPAMSKQSCIMIVDDSPTIRKLVGATLTRQGYDVISAVDGMDALSKLNEQSPDLILLDITMPRMDGYQLCRIVKNNNETKDIPVIMLSGNDGFFDKVRGRMSGSTDYITKPFEPRELAQTVNKYTRR